MRRRALSRVSGVLIALAAIVVAVALFRNYLFSGSALLFGDANFLWTKSQLDTELLQMLHVWRVQSGGISGAVGNATQSYVLLQALFSPLGIPLSTVLVWPALIAASFLAMRKLALNLGADGSTALVAAAFYAGNPWLWDQLLAGHAAICAAAALAPWVLSTLVRLYRNEPGAGWLLMALCGLQLLADARIALFVYATMFVALIVGVLRLRAAGKANATRFATFTLAALAGGIVANAWWTALYAFAKTGDPVPAFYPPVEDITTYSGSADFAHALVLSGYFMHFEWQRMLQFGWVPFALWYAAILFLLVVPAIAAKKRVIRWIATAALPIALVASMGSYGLPLWLLKWMLAHVPLMGLLREPVKYGFVVALSISTLLTLWLSSASKRVRIVAGIAVLIAIFPVFTGTLNVPDGHGLQAFSERKDFLQLFDFLRAHGGEDRYRIAFLPPWLAEQSLGPGQFYVANPFVFQSEIPEIDAKLINTATATDNAAWQAFYGLYWGTDTHAAQTLGAFGIRYVILDDDAVMSQGAQFTSFAGVPPSRLHYLISQDRGFRLVYERGPYSIYEDRYFEPLVRTARSPLVRGPVAPAVRSALPADALGDDIDRNTAQPAASGISAVARTPLDACVDSASYAGLTNAYAHVGKHSDYTGFWVASDWMVRGGDSLQSRLLQRFTLPFAYTQSSNTINAPIEASAPGTLYVQLGALASRADVQVMVDGKAAARFSVNDKGFAWYRIAGIRSGKHVVTIAGNAAGTLARNIAVVTSSCDNPPLLQGTKYVVHDPSATARLRIKSGLARAMSGGKTLATFAIPRGAAAATVDGTPVGVRPFTLFRGVHNVQFYAPEGNDINGWWTLDGAVAGEGSASTMITPRMVRLGGGTSKTVAASEVNGLQSGQITLFRYRIKKPVDNAQLWVHTPDGSINTEVGDMSVGDHAVLIPYIGPSYRLLFSIPAGTPGQLVIEDPIVTWAHALESEYFTLPAAGARAALPLSPSTFRLNGDGALDKANAGDPQIWTPLKGQSALQLRLRGVAATRSTPVVVTAYYDVPFAPQQQYVVASFDADRTQTDATIDVPVLPHARAVAFSVHAATPSASISLRNAALTSSSSDGFTVVVPHERASGGVGLSYRRVSPEELQLNQSVRGWLVGEFTYDPYWVAPAGEHWKADGRENAWYLPSPTRVTLRYRLQGTYHILQLLALAFYIITIALWTASLIRVRVLRKRETDLSYRYGN